jgi:F-type H+-transporting ATPase subunit b
MLIFALPEWVNYPGLELWKFADLAIFITVAVVILRKPLSNALEARRERIKAEIAKAESERATATDQLAEAQALWAHVNDDVDAIHEQARQEVILERQRQAAAAEKEIARLKAQGEREIELARKAAHKTLREFLASRSLQIARQSVINRLRPQDDDVFIKDRIDELRRVRS